MSVPSRARRPRRSRTYWSRVVAEQDASDLSARAFCAERDLGLRTFLRWKRKLNGSAQAPSPAPFVELAVPGVAPPPSARGWEVELELGEGVRLRFRRP